VLATAVSSLPTAAVSAARENYLHRDLQTARSQQSFLTVLFSSLLRLRKGLIGWPHFDIFQNLKFDSNRHLE